MMEWNDRYTYVASSMPALTIPPPPDHAPDEQLIDYAAIIGFGMWLPQLHAPHVDQVLRCARAYLRKWHPTDPQVRESRE